MIVLEVFPGAQFAVQGMLADPIFVGAISKLIINGQPLGLRPTQRTLPDAEIPSAALHSSNAAPWQQLGNGHIPEIDLGLERAIFECGPRLQFSPTKA